MATVTLEAKKRESIGTGSARADRREGFVPCVVYGDNQPSENICIAKDLLSRYVYKSNFFSTVFEINGIGKKGQKFVAKQAQIHPVTDQVMHVDFMRVGKGSRVTVRVPVVFTNENASPGLKLGGVLNVLAHEIDVVCDPEKIPEHIEVDLTGFEFHHTVHSNTVKLPEGVSLPVNAKTVTIATVVAPTIMKTDTPSAEASSATTEAGA
ncbi:MAG: 50S ribosomal protein L25/general stress protein Ctc [Alphaproteobacteria bacterium]|nr:50S ribosomal protein L25/general stress protein Ctc [Alphaproteobacteria bacterium]